MQFQFQCKTASQCSEACLHSPSLSRLPVVALELVPMFFHRTQIVPDLRGWNVSHFLSPLLFRSDNQCWDALACPCSESKSSSSLWALLPCPAADQMWYLLCLPVCMPVHSHWLWHGQGSRSTEVFAAKHCAWLGASQGYHANDRYIKTEC